MRHAFVTRILYLTLVTSFLFGPTVGEGKAQTNCRYQRCMPETGHPLGKPGTDNIEVISHLPLPGEPFSHSDIEIEQEMSRPFAYVAQRFGTSGFYAIGLEDPSDPRILYRWIISNPELHVGSGGLDPKYFKINDRYYLALGFQFEQGGPDADLGAIIFDVTGLPDGSAVSKVAELRVPEYPGGFHNIYAYKHSNGMALLFATTESEDIFIYDLAQVIDGATEPIATIPVPQPSEQRTRQWHDIYVGFHPASGQDRFYGGGTGGFYVFDITALADPRLIVTITNIPGIDNGHTFTPTPDGNFALAMPEPTYQHSPIRIFDLRPALEGDNNIVTGAGIGAWIPKWNGATHNHEIRWPYAFISAQDDGLQVINIMDPANPYTQAYYITREGPSLYGAPFRTATHGNIYGGAWGVDVRNADGLIVVSDFNSGFWAFHMEGFNGWNGHSWGMPNISSAQDWDNGPVAQAQRMPY